MEVKAKLKYLRIAPRKVRLVADLVRGKSVEEAQTILDFSIKRAATPLGKLLKSAIANAKSTSGLEGSNLYISKITVDEGPKLKRWRARSRGQAFEIQKKTSHINLVLSEIEGKTKKTKKTKAKKAKVDKVKPVKAEKLEKAEEVKPKEKPKFRPRRETKRPETATQRVRKMFRRKSF